MREDSWSLCISSSLFSPCYPCLMCKVSIYIENEIFDTVTILESWCFELIWELSSYPCELYNFLNQISRNHRSLVNSMRYHSLYLNFGSICSTFQSLILDVHQHHWCRIHLSYYLFWPNLFFQLFWFMFWNGAILVKLGDEFVCVCMVNCNCVSATLLWRGWK